MVDFGSLSLKSKKIITVLGTRPEAIKLAPLILKLNFDSEFHHKVCLTGQHREMVNGVFNLFDTTYDHDLDIMTANQSLNEICSKVVTQFGKILKEEKPDLVIVHGDTLTAFAASLAAFFEKIKIAHIEAGLRTRDKFSPFPEEMNRRLVSPIADFHFAPTKLAAENLLKEGVPSEQIYVTGNTVIDSLKLISKKLQENSDVLNKAKAKLGFIDPMKKVVLITGHRRETFGKQFLEICAALRDLANSDKNLQLIYPVHPNPNVKGPAEAELGGISNISLIKPLEYEEFIYLMQISDLVITDSGGIQEEAPSLNLPVLVTREKTERVEALKAGTIELVGSSRVKIIERASTYLAKGEDYNRMISAKNPYGDGSASQSIVSKLSNVLV